MVVVNGWRSSIESKKKSGKMVWIYIAIKIDGDGGLDDEPDLEQGGT